jgi:3',5'-cyclic AMP phosphodiesterase CpdA
MKKKSIPALFLLLIVFILYCNPAFSWKASDPENFKFAFLTDIHIEFSQKTLTNFNKTIDKINSIHPDFIITGGDNVKDARQPRESYADSLFNLYTSLVKKFRMPVHTGIGNHEFFGMDNPAIQPSNASYGPKMYQSKIGKTYYSFEHKGWKFFMINDVKNNETGKKYIGFIDEEQMQWIKKELAATDPSTPIVVCAHIPFISSMKKFEFGSLSGTPDNDGVANSKEFFKLFEKHNLKLVLQGHFHFFEVLYANNIYYITSPAPTSGFFMFETDRDSLKWEFVKN